MNYKYLKPIDQEEIRAVENQGRAVSSTSSAVGGGALAAGLGLSFLGGDFIYPLLKFMIIVKIVGRLKFMNVQLGELLETFIDNIGGAFDTSGGDKDNENWLFDWKYRYKLSRYNIAVLAWLDLY